MHIGRLWHPDDAYPPRREPDILGIPWRGLPLTVRQKWLVEETKYGKREPSPEFLANLPEFIAAEQAKLEVEKREVAVETARGLAELRLARELARRWFPYRMRGRAHD